jgi:hypothetical protein
LVFKEFLMHTEHRSKSVGFFPPDESHYTRPGMNRVKGVAPAPLKVETVWCVRGMKPTQSYVYYSAEALLKVPCEALKNPVLLAAALDCMNAYPGALRLVGMTQVEEEAAAVLEKRDGVPVLFAWKKMPGVIE